MLSVHLMHQLRHIPQVALGLHCLPQLVRIRAVQLVLLVGVVDDPVLLTGGHLPAVDPRYTAFLTQVPQDSRRFGAGGIFPQCPDAAVGIAEDVMVHLELHHARCDAIQKGADKCLLRRDLLFVKRVFHSIHLTSRKIPCAAPAPVRGR